jgi:flagellar hook assembly protein FlgD
MKKLLKVSGSMFFVFLLFFIFGLKLVNSQVIGNLNVPEFILISKSIYTQGYPQVNSANNRSTSTMVANFRFIIKAKGGDVTIPKDAFEISTTTPTGFVFFSVFKNGVEVPLTINNIYNVSFYSPTGNVLNGQVIKDGEEKEIYADFSLRGRDRSGKSLPDGNCSVRLSSVKLVYLNNRLASTTFVSAADPKKWETNNVTFECGPVENLNNVIQAPEYTLISKNIYTQGSPQINSTSNMSTSTLLATFRFKIKAVGSDVVIPYNLNTLSSTTPTGFVNFNLFKNNINVPITSDNLYSVTYLSSDGSTLTSQVIKRGQEKEIIANFNFLGRDKKGKPLSDGVCSVRLSSVRLLDSNGNFASTTFVSAADPKKWETNGVAFECGPTYNATTTSVTVINPNGWEKLLTGQAYRINWTGGSKRVDIWLLDAPTKVGQKIFSAVDNNGFKDWTVRKLIETFYNPNTGKVEKISGNYLIRIDCIESGCNDLSNSPFTISSSTPPVASTTPTLTPYPINIIRPNGDKYNAGSDVTINWRTEGVIPTVSIEILNSKGSEVIFLRSAVNNTGSYVYTIPASTVSGNYIVRIKGSNGAIATSYFTVYAVASTNAYPVVTPATKPVYTPTPTATPSYSPTPSPSYSPTPTTSPSPSYSPSPSPSYSPSPSSSAGAYMNKGILKASIWDSIKSLFGF